MFMINEKELSHSKKKEEERIDGIYLKRHVCLDLKVKWMLDNF